MVVQLRREPAGAPRCQPDASGDRPGTSALEAVGPARQRCWQRAWGMDRESQGCVDTIAHALLLRAVQKPAPDRWVVLSMARGLKAPAPDAAGQGPARGKGTPHGGVISPLRANRLLHEAFDGWLQSTYPPLPCERDADDALVPCRTAAAAQEGRDAMAARRQACRLELHAEQTQIVYGQADDRRGTSPHETVAVLGETFRPRRSKHRWGQYCLNVSPAVADQAGQARRAEMRDWQRHLRRDTSLDERSRRFNPKIRGGLHYEGRS